MSYHVIDPGSLQPTPGHPCDRRSLTEAIGLDTLALAVYEIEPGEQLATDYHYHEQREEAFATLTGTLHVETPDANYRVTAGEIFVAEPGNPHRAYNPADAEGAVTVLGMGAPRYDAGRRFEPASSE